ncbi:MAG TPA: hypothetical protein VF630_18175, partial [Hymenobacter sp.]
MKKAAGWGCFSENLSFGSTLFISLYHAPHGFFPADGLQWFSQQFFPYFVRVALLKRVAKAYRRTN